MHVPGADRRGLRPAFLGAVALVVSVPISHVSAAPAELPLSYLACPPAPGDPGRINIAASPKGPVVTYVRKDLGTPATRDVNLAFVSRRLFFKLRTAAELIEFQGHARDGELEGVLSDHAGARHIAMRADPSGRGCGNTR